MAFCVKCGSKLKDGDASCASCGAPVPTAQAPVLPPVTPLPEVAPAPGYPAPPPDAATTPRRNKNPIIIGLVALAMVVIVGVMLIATLGGGKEEVAGKYYDTELGSLLELRSDGTFIQGEGELFKGTYTTSGNKITLSLDCSDEYDWSVEGTIGEGKIVIDETTYVKK